MKDHEGLAENTGIPGEMCALEESRVAIWSVTLRRARALSWARLDSVGRVGCIEEKAGVESLYAAI